MHDRKLADKRELTTLSLMKARVSIGPCQWAQTTNACKAARREALVTQSHPVM